MRNSTLTLTARGSTASPNLPDYRTSGQQRFFSYRTSATNPASNTFANGERLRLSPQGYYYYGPWGLLAEYVTVSQDVDRALGGGTADFPRDREDENVVLSRVQLAF